MVTVTPVIIPIVAKNHQSAIRTPCIQGGRPIKPLFTTEHFFAGLETGIGEEYPSVGIPLLLRLYFRPFDSVDGSPGKTTVILKFLDFFPCRHAPVTTKNDMGSIVAEFQLLQVVDNASVIVFRVILDKTFSLLRESIIIRLVFRFRAGLSPGKEVAGLLGSGCSEIPFGPFDGQAQVNVLHRRTFRLRGVWLWCRFWRR